MDNQNRHDEALPEVSVYGSQVELSKMEELPCQLGYFCSLFVTLQPGLLLLPKIALYLG